MLACLGRPVMTFRVWFSVCSHTLPSNYSNYLEKTIHPDKTVNRINEMMLFWTLRNKGKLIRPLCPTPVAAQDHYNIYKTIWCPPKNDRHIITKVVILAPSILLTATGSGQSF
jgi:hypothetical protein